MSNLFRDNLYKDIVDPNARLDNHEDMISEALADIAWGKSKDGHDIEKIKQSYYPLDTTYDNALRKALEFTDSVYFYVKVVFPKKSTKYTFSTSTPIVLKQNVFLEFLPGAEVDYTGTAASLFTNDPTSASLFLRVYGGGRFNVNDRTIFKFRYETAHKATKYGCKVTLNDLRFDGVDGAVRQGSGLDIGYTDFLMGINLTFTDMAQGINIYADRTWTRGNTQIVLDTISMVNVKTGLEYDRLDKASFRNIDIAQCDIGFLAHSSNQLVRYTNCHVEYFDSYAFKCDDGGNMHTSFEECSIFNPKDTATAGFYSTQLSWGKSQNYFKFKDCDFTKASLVESSRSTAVKTAPGYVAYVGFYCPSPFEWRGIDFEHPGFNKVSNDFPVGSARIYTDAAVAKSRNLLPIANFNDSSLMHTADGTMTIGASTDYYSGVRLTWSTTAGGQVYRIKSDEPLKVGWHTLVLQASQINNNNISMLISRSNFTTVLNQNIAELSFDYREGIMPRRTGIKTQELVIPFFVDTAGDHYFAFLSAGATTYDIAMGGIQLFSGFVTEYKSIPREWKKATAPTAGYWYKGDTVTNPSAAVAGDKIGWRCVSTGSPGTWLGTGVYTAP